MRIPWLLSVAMVASSSSAAQLDLATVRGIEHFPGDADARAKLAQLGFVTLPGTDPAMSRAYRNLLPPLVTVDVVLHAVIVQQRAMMRQIEEQLAPVLAEFCARGFALAGARAAESRAHADAARFLGLARRAHGDGWQPAQHGELLADAVSGAEPWLCVDTQELEPGSAYRGDRALERYFMARRWLGTRRFVMQRPAHAECARAIAKLVRDDAELRAAHTLLTGPFDAWLGPADVDLVSTQSLPERGAVGLLPGRELPCDRTLRRVATEGLPSWPFTILATGALRSNPGRELLGARHGEATATAVHDLVDPPGPPSLYLEFLRAVASVHDPLPAAAPALFHGPAWQRRLCETQLGAWVTMYEVVSAHSVRLLGGRGEKPPGYVAPYPQTFVSVAKLARNLEALAAAWDRSRKPPARELSPSRDALRWRATAAREVITALRNLDDTEAEELVRTLFDRCARGESLTPEQTAIVHAMGSDLILTRCALSQLAHHSEHFAQIAMRQLRDEPLEPDDVALFGKLDEAISDMTFAPSGEDLPIMLPFRPDIGPTTWLGTTKHDALYAIIDCGGTPTLLFGAVYGVAESVRPADQPWRAKQWLEAAFAGELPRPAEFADYRAGRTPR